MYQRIIVPLDGSAVAEQALDEAELFARALNAELILIRIIDLPHLREGGTSAWKLQQSALEQLVNQERSEAEEYLANVVLRYADRELRVSVTVLQGPVPETLVESCATGDLIVMTTHGRSGVRRWFLGSVAEQVVRIATVPVLLIRAADQA